MRTFGAWLAIVLAVAVGVAIAPRVKELLELGAAGGSIFHVSYYGTISRAFGTLVPLSLAGAPMPRMSDGVSGNRRPATVGRP